MSAKPEKVVSLLDVSLEREALASFEALGKVALSAPGAAAEILERMGRSPEAYPDGVAAIYLLGQIHALVALAAVSPHVRLEVAMVVKHLLASQGVRYDKAGIAPHHVVGPKRKFHRTGRYPAPEPGEGT